MTNSQAKPGRRASRLFVLVAAICAFAALPLLSSARARTASINVVNNSSREIIHVYLSPANSDDWGPNQLADSATIASGQSFTVSNVACDQPQIKVVAEDTNGCFLSTVVTCGDAATWTITNDTVANCGGQ